MADVLFLALVVAGFALLRLGVAALDRLVSTDGAPTDPAEPAQERP